MSLRLSRKTLALTLVGTFISYLLFGWLALPRIIQSQAQSYIAAHTGHRLTLDQPQFNPFTLNLRLSNLRLEEPDGKPLFAFRELDVDVSISSLFRRALVFDAIRLDGPDATVVLQRDGKLNWSALVDALKGKEEPPRETNPDTSLPRVDIQHFMLSAGRVNFTDDKTAFATHFEPLELELSDISTLPDDHGSYRIEARSAFGAHILWQGQMSLAPVAIGGTLGIDHVDLSRLAPYLKDVLPIAPPSGMLALSTEYRATYDAKRFDLTLDNLSAGLKDLRLRAAQDSDPAIAIDSIAASKGHFDLTGNQFALNALTINGSEIALARHNAEPLKLLHLGALALDDIRVDLAKHDLTLAHVALKDGELKAVRDAHDHLDVLDALQAAFPAAPAKPKTGSGAQKTQTAKAAPWHYRVAKFELAGFSTALRDESVTPAADLALQNIALGVDGISDDLTQALPLQLTLQSRGGGSLEVRGKVVPAEPSADLRLKLSALSLQPVQPYLASFARLTLAGGQLNSEGQASYNQRGGKFKGNFALRDLRLIETETGDTFLAWKSLGSRDLEASQSALNIGELAIDGLESKLIIHKDKSVNLVRILRNSETPGAAPATPPPAAPARTDENKEAPLLVNIDRVKVSNGAMNFADYSLALPFGTSIHDLHGSLSDLSSRPDARGQVELDGQVDDYGIARAAGQVDLFDPTGFMDLKVVFRNVEMTRLTPYSATFAGRKIDSGKLSLNLEYKIKKRQIEGENQVIMDQLTLGDRVESPDAMNLPLDLAIAILQDTDGRIDLGLPVSGSLDDPQFSYGRIIWKALLNVVGKIATAPFRALGALFGGGEKFESIAFDIGKQQLSPPEREKLTRLAGALNKRPKLALTVHGVYAEADRNALQDLQLRRAVAMLAGLQVDEQEDPGSLSTHSPKIQTALESLYAERIGAHELAALKQGYRLANPEPKGRDDKQKSSEKSALNEQEIAQLKGADFHAVLYQRLLAREAITDAQLQALAQTRGENTLAALLAANAPMQRVQLAAPLQADAAERDVPLKLELGAAPKTVAPVTDKN
ncbi:MAG: DUF748 domain-containing protein [Nitrosomonadales bacterium]|nr:DUF748 domain-containing protein [Nitrosomonadales bacterium]